MVPARVEHGANHVGARREVEEVICAVDPGDGTRFTHVEDFIAIQIDVDRHSGAGASMRPAGDCG